MFSRWAIKRICKFLLKKKLGKFILGDIDLNQLDVQLGAGTIQLSDLALNVDYINEKFGTAPILVKEGSVGSLMVTMPWKDGGCRIEVDELEVVLAPRRVNVYRDEFETSCHSKNDDNSSSHSFRKRDNETPNSGVANSPVDVHEGVKTIAKMVKWLLTSFHVKIRKLIVAFDPLLEEENKKGLDRILVLRIGEAECGTHISEDACSSSFNTVHNFLGLSRLTNFVKFQGAVIELLHVDGLDHQSPPEFPTETSIGNWFSGYCSSGNMTTIISGEKGGFSGNLKLSLPWKNGSLDIRKVDADLHIEPLELRLQPSTIRYFIIMWDLFKGVSEGREDLGHHEPSDGLSAPSSSMRPPEKGQFGNEGFVTNSCLMEKEPVHSLLSESNLISDWVSRSWKDRNEEEPDFGASVDQFFECFDGLRNSQSALGNSGMWNWTCSVFSAITAASNLASGSLHVPSEQQHVETNFNAAIAKVSLLLSFIDEDQKQPPKMKDDKANTDFYIHCVCAQFVDSCLTLQVRPVEMNFEVIVQHIQLVDHLCSKNELVDHNADGCNDNLESETALIQKMQDGVQAALLTFQDSHKDPGIDASVNHSVDISLSTQEMNGCCHMTNGKVGGKDFRSFKPTPVASSDRRHTLATSCSVNLNFCDFYLFSISSDFTEKIVGSETYNRQEASFSVEKIISVVNGSGHPSLISMLWQEGPATGPWIAKKAKLLASLENGRNEDKVVGRGCEFASVTTVKDSKYFDTRFRQEILSSSAFFLHGQLPPSQIGKNILHRKTSILVECDSVTFSLAIEPVGDECSTRSEIPGSWSSLTLQVDKFDLLSVSDIGGIRSANFMWVAHGQGSLWGSITEGLHREFLLISCSDSTMGRGDGEGSNVLSSRHSGSDIINFWDPESNHSFTSITVRGATIVAIGGRMDWFNTIFSFFSLPSSEFEQAGNNSPDKTCGSSFILNLVDVGLSYEPYLEKLTANQGSDLKYSDLSSSETEEELHVACMLAASSLKLSNNTLVDCNDGVYKIKLQDLGFLICLVSASELVSSTYSVAHLSKIGYVKVAQEAHVEALFRTNCENGHSWELECGIMRNRCMKTMMRTEGGEFSPSLSRAESPSPDKKSKVGNLMDEIREDAFQLDGNSDGRTKFFESHLCALVSDSSLVASGASSAEEKVPEFIEEYFLSDLRPLSGLALRNQSPDILCCKTGAVGEARIGNGGWYADTSLRILENHASKAEQVNVRKPVNSEASTSDPEHDVGKAEGRILLKNMNVIWRMHGGSDWSNFQNTSQTSAVSCSRDPTVCLELALSGIGLDYDVYPDGEISASKLSLTIQDFCLNDRSDDAPWKLVLLNYLTSVLRIAILPMRLHLHQSQLDFLINFFGGKNSSADSSPSTLGLSKSGEPFEKSDNLQGRIINEEAFLPYFQESFDPCRVDLTALRGGNYVELVNLVPWKGVELQLKHVQGVGLYGWGSVCETILGEWLEDISQNQIHKLLKGLPPIKSLVAVGSGAAKLVSLPVKNYKKDHRVLKGMQRGTFAFLRSISLEAIGLGVHLAAGAHNVLLQAEYILASIPPSVPWPVENRVGSNVKSNQPNDAQQGIQQAYQSISDGLGKSASALSAPAAAIAPASGAARAVHCALLGFRNSLDPERKRESLEKYLGRTPPHESMQ
ncbi:hypothetical protein DH2020_029341 [Rehmannia glutinosa]|uniref:Autophagy-related protein 2 n=1 Tax=Rehmannia glutinosa TaxID=99300 RepID=A0ABR0VNS2_REHGL